MKNKLFSLLLLLALAVLLCACGDAGQISSVPEATVTPAPVESTETPAAEASAPEQAAAPVLPDAGLHAAAEKTEADPEIAKRLELAKSFVDKDVQDLIDELGEPLERTYAPSCLGSGEDGELRYEGFSVYTYREGERETVTDVA